MTYYITDWDRIGNQFFNNRDDAAKKADELAKKFRGNRVNVYDLKLSQSFYYDIDPKKAALRKAEAVLDKVWKEYVQNHDDKEKTKEALDAIRNLMVE